jgi:hypothetical protein
VRWQFCTKALEVTGNRGTRQDTIPTVTNMQQHPRSFFSSQRFGPRRPGADGAASDGTDHLRRPPGACAGPTSEPTSIYDPNAYTTQRRTSSGRRQDAAAAGGSSRRRRARFGDPTTSLTEGNSGIAEVAHFDSGCGDGWHGREARRANRVRQKTGGASAMA